MRNYNHIILILTLAVTACLNGQIVISKPNLGFSQACASPNFNTYNLSFTFSPENGLSASNQFIVELSDESGSFDNPEILFTSQAGEINSSPASVQFSFPNTIAGENFKVRVKSTSPVATSASSNGFAAYFKFQDSPFTINNLISSAAFCAGSSYTLSIDNPGTGSNDSPLQYPQLTFDWYLQTSETTSVFIASGETLTVQEAGKYYVKTNYGTCTSDSFSNRVTVSEASASSESSINSSLGNPFCPDEGPTTLTAIAADGYQWFKDGVALPDSNAQSISTEDSAEYSVNIDLGECSTTAKISLESELFTSEINVTEIAFLEENQSMEVIITTDAINPDFFWYLNETLISDATGSSYDITETGNYKVRVAQTDGCEVSKEFQFRIASAEDVAEIPNVISPNGDGINDTWIIPQDYLSGSNTSVMIYDSQGKVVFQSTEYANNWPQDQIDRSQVNPVYYYIISNQDKGDKKGSLTVIR